MKKLGGIGQLKITSNICLPLRSHCLRYELRFRHSFIYWSYFTPIFYTDSSYESWVWTFGTEETHGCTQHETLWTPSSLNWQNEWFTSMDGVCWQLNGSVGTSNYKVHCTIFKLLLLKLTYSIDIFVSFLFRILNLELMSEYGCESWRIHNSVLTQMIQQAQKMNQDLRFVWSMRK